MTRDQNKEAIERIFDKLDKSIQDNIAYARENVRLFVELLCADKEPIPKKESPDQEAKKGE